MSKEELQEYIDVMRLAAETEKRIKRIEKNIERLEGKVDTADIVMGGYGGGRHYRIEGSAECTKMRTELMRQKLHLEKLDRELMKKSWEVEKFIESIKELRKKRIFLLRYIDGMSWEEVAREMGPGNTADAIRMEHGRYMDRYGSD